jgi:ribosomal protein S18 acetylase RimI-like enzyme
MKSLERKSETMELLVREACDQDILSIIELRKELDDNHAELMPNLFSNAYSYSDDDVRSYFSSDKSMVYVVEDQKTNITLGYFILRRECVEERLIYKAKSMLYVNDICVRKDYRGQGIGKYIFNYIIETARKHGFDTVELNVFAANVRAVQLYESIGMKEQNKRMVLNLRNNDV